MKTGGDYESEIEFVSTSTDPSSSRFPTTGASPHFRSACQGIWSLVGSAVNKMMSSMSYSPQPELFARSLRRRLQSLTPDRSREQTSSPHEATEVNDQTVLAEGEQPQAMVVPLAEEGEEERIRRILERGLKFRDGGIIQMHRSFPLPGTTFPPNRFVNGDLVRTKFRSESDLFPALENQTHESDGRENDSENASEILPEGSNEVCDSDLFFDFDIGSPEPAEVDEVDHVINETDDGMQLLALGKMSPTGSEVSSNSPTLLDAHSGSPLRQSPSTTEPSTAYGSTSSGLFSDAEVSSQTDRDEDCSGPDIIPDLLEGFSLHPEDWIKNQQTLYSNKSASVTPVVSPPNTQTSENAESSLANENDVSDDSDKTLSQPEAGNNESNDLSDESLHEEGQEMKVCIGETEKLVAHSKLQALLAQLEQGKEFSSNPPTLGKNVRSSLSESQLLSTSPANFSFLVGSAGVASSSSNNNLAVKTSMGRCQSTLDMSDFDKSKVRSSPKSNEAIFLEQQKSNKKRMDDLKSSSASEEESDKRDKYRKCSSLRSGKTPPGTPARRKIVRFADVFGLDLADVKTFLDEVPNVPKSAFKDLKDAELSDMESDAGSELHFPVLPPTGPPTIPTFTAPSKTPTIAPLFNQPSGSSEFFNHLRDKKVCLESAYMSDMTTIKGIARVVNLDYNKRVLIRYTTDDWTTTIEVVGEYLVGSCDGFSDKFNFVLDYSSIAGMVGRRLQFCVKFECAGNDYWDNNFGKNYIFQCFGPPPVGATPIGGVKSAPIETPGQAIRSSAFGTFSHSPSALSEDPWLRYL